jgi:hypothetical protein
MVDRIPLTSETCPTYSDISSTTQLTEEQFAARLDAWVCNYDCAPGSNCERCNGWKDNPIAFPHQYIRAEDTATLTRSGVNPFDYEKLCNLWVSPDFLAESCEFFDRKHEGIPRVTIAVASDLLYRLSGKQFSGACMRKVYPGCCEPGRSEPQYWDLPHLRDLDYAYRPNGLNGTFGGTWNGGYNISACGDVGSCSCGGGGGCSGGCNPSEILLPGPIADVVEIAIDGQILPRSAYKIRSHNKLIRVDGGVWPAYNDLTRSPYDSPTPVVVSTGAAAKTWVDCWKDDMGLNLCHEATDAYPQVNAPTWVNTFLRKNPSILTLLPYNRTWVGEWLDAHGIKLAKCADPEAPTYMSQTQAFVYGTAAPGQCCHNPDGLEFPMCCKLPTVAIMTGADPTPCPEAAALSAAHWLLYGPDESGPVTQTYQWNNDPCYDAVVKSLNSSSQGGCHSWSITYLQGKCPPISGQLAAAELARLIARKICTDQCLPENVRRVTAEGIDYRLSDRNSSLFGMPSIFGNMIIDTWLFSVNPAGLQRNGSIHRADQRSRKIRSIR